MASLGYPPGNAGVLAAYDGMITDLVIDRGDAEDELRLDGSVRIHITDTRLVGDEASARFASWFAQTFA